MTPPDLFPISLIVAMVVLVLVRQGIQLVIRSRLPARMYLRYIYPRRMTQAYDRGDARQAEQQVYRAYLDQLLDPNPVARNIAVQYLEQLTATRELAQKLIEALSNQRRNDVQERLARLLRNTLHDLAKNDSAKSPGHHLSQPAWSWALTIWLTEAILIVVGWFLLPPVSLEQFLLLGLIVTIVTYLPLTWIVRRKRLLVQFTVLSTGIALAVLWSFSEMVHTGTGFTPRVGLDAYGFEGVQVQIAYPRWLTAEDVGSCSDRADKVTIMVLGAERPGSDPIEISFMNDLTVLNITNKDCGSVGTRFNVSTSSSAGEPIDFYVRPTNREVLTRSSVTMRPLVRNPNSEAYVPAFPVGELTFEISLEDPVWKAIRDICKVGAGVTTLPAFLSYLIDRIRKRE